LKYDHEQPISVFCEVVYIGALKGSINVEYFDNYLRVCIEEKLEYASQQNLIDLLVGFSAIGLDQNDSTFVRALGLVEEKLKVKYENVTSTVCMNDSYEGVSENTRDYLSNATYAEYARAFGKNGGMSDMGRYKYLFRFVWDPIKFFVFGRVFRRSWSFTHVYDMPSEQEEIKNLRKALGQKSVGEGNKAEQ